MEKLIVKNFGPIKEAEIDLTKYVVFIGDTSTGKSVLAKLIAIFRDSYIELSIYEGKMQIDFRDELKKYNIDFDSTDSEFEYFSDNRLTLKVLDNNIVLISTQLKNAFSHTFDAIVRNQLDKITIPANLKIDPEALIRNIITSTNNSLFGDIKSVYFPAERLIYILTGNSMAGLSANNISLPECYKEFAAHFEKARSELKKLTADDFDIEYNFSDGFEEISYNGMHFKLEQASSGIQSLTPLLLVLEYNVNSKESEMSKSLIFEEPELNLFPIKQKRITEYIVRKIKPTRLLSIITTHSPYILSALDTLILAKNTYNEHPDLKDEIAAIVSEDKWIDYNDISVYEVLNDGTIRSIKNEEFKSIDTNAIDRVSDIISEEFDKLTELRYAQ